jgi:hypothetical protein
MESILKKLSDPTFDNSRSVMPSFGLSNEQKQAIAEYLVWAGNQEPRERASSPTGWRTGRESAELRFQAYLMRFQEALLRLPKR